MYGRMTALLEGLARSGGTYGIMTCALLEGLARSGGKKRAIIIALLEGFARRLKTLYRC
jgi:hypothetical protein